VFPFWCFAIVLPGAYIAWHELAHRSAFLSDQEKGHISFLVAAPFGCEGQQQIPLTERILLQPINEISGRRQADDEVEKYGRDSR
jgi:hypothetical protein